MAGIAAVAVAAAGTAVQARNARQAREQASRAAEQGAAAADPAAGERGQYQDLLRQMFPALSATNTQQIMQDPSFKFQQEQGTTAATNQASAAGLLRSGTLLEDLSKFNQDLSSTYVDKQFGRNQQIMQMLGTLGGFTTGSPGTAGNIMSQGGQFGAQFGYNAGNATLGAAGGAINQIGSYFTRPNASYGGGGGSYYGGGSAGNPGGNWDSPG